MSGGYHWCYVKYKDDEDYINNIIHQSSRKGVPIYCIELSRRFDSAKSASLELGIDSSSITKCCKGKAKTVGGYHWVYFDIDIIKEQGVSE